MSPPPPFGLAEVCYLLATPNRTSDLRRRASFRSSEPKLTIIHFGVQTAVDRVIAIGRTSALVANSTLCDVSRSYLIFRFAMHLGARQRNLRELLICPKDSVSKTVSTCSSRFGRPPFSHRRVSVGASSLFTRGRPRPKDFLHSTTPRRHAKPRLGRGGILRAMEIYHPNLRHQKPLTGRGAVAGLLPHGPHSVRDVLATTS